MVNPRPFEVSVTFAKEIVVPRGDRFVHRQITRDNLLAPS